MKDKDSKEAKHLLATIGSLTGSGGRATTAKEGFALRNLGVARVGDNGTNLGSPSAGNAATAIESAPSSLAAGTFDEQVRAAVLGAALKDYPYFIKTADGRTSCGRTDADGNLPRIETQEAIDYTVYWGDAALAKQDGN
jgi:hypothetical protein